MSKTKRKYKKKALPARLSILVTPERRHQQGGVTTEYIDHDLRGNAKQKRHKAVIECHLDIYKYREQISEVEYQAGMIYRRAFQRYVLGIKVDDRVQGGRADAEMAMLAIPASKKILDQAQGALSLPQNMVVRAVCGLDDTAGNSHRLETLQRGLEKLAAIWETS